MKIFWISLCCLLAASLTISATQVEAEGRAPGDQKTAREQALADALREAVRKGTVSQCARIDWGVELRFGF